MTNQVPQIFSDRRRNLRHSRALARQQRPGAARWLIDAMADDVIERLGFLRWEGDHTLIAGLGGERVADALGKPHGGARVDYTRPLPGGPYDLIVSLGELDTVNDLPGALIHLRHALAPNGVLIAEMLAAGSVPKLRGAMLAADGDRPAARIHPLIDSRAMSGLMQRAGFIRQVVDKHTFNVQFQCFAQLIDDMRDQGMGNVLLDQGLTVNFIGYERAVTAFELTDEDDARTSERFELVTVTGWKD